MCRAIFTTLAVIVLSTSQSFAQEFAVEKATDPISEHDLLAVLQASGSVFVRYDVEIPSDFCLNVYLQKQVGAEEMSETSFGHLCYLAGPHRLMVLWRRTGDEIHVSAHTHRRDEIGNGGSTSTTLTIPGAFGWSTHSVDAPSLSSGTKTLVADFGYSAAPPGQRHDPDQIETTRLKVLLELRPNPHKELSSGGRHVQY